MLEFTKPFLIAYPWYVPIGLNPFSETAVMPGVSSLKHYFCPYILCGHSSHETPFQVNAVS